MSSIELADRSVRRFQWVMNFDAFQAKKKFAGVRSKQENSAG